MERREVWYIHTVQSLWSRNLEVAEHPEAEQREDTQMESSLFVSEHMTSPSSPSLGLCSPTTLSPTRIQKGRT